MIKGTGIIAFVTFFSCASWTQSANSQSDLDKSTTASLRYRFEITFDVQGQVRTFGGVQELTVKQTPRFVTSASPTSEYIRGQAIFVNFEDHPPMLVLMKVLAVGNVFERTNFEDLFLDACGLKPNLSDQTRDEYISTISDFHGKCDIPAEKMPLLVKLDGEVDYNPISYVDPTRMEQTYAGIRFIEARMVTTDEEIDLDLGENLPWIFELDALGLHATPLEGAPRRVYLNTTDFIRE